MDLISKNNVPTVIPITTTKRTYIGSIIHDTETNDPVCDFQPLLEPPQIRNKVIRLIRESRVPRTSRSKLSDAERWKGGGGWSSIRSRVLSRQWDSAATPEAAGHSRHATSRKQSATILVISYLNAALVEMFQCGRHNGSPSMWYYREARR